jgi:predicted nucleic acid-binding protein
MVYLDTSAMVSLFLNERRTTAVQQVVAEAADGVVVSDLTIGEHSAAVMTNVRVGRLTAAQSVFLFDGSDAWVDAGALLIEIERDDFRVAIDFVRRADLGLLLPDALHLAICRRIGATLVSGDKRQADAADALGIPVKRV